MTTYIELKAMPMSKRALEALTMDMAQKNITTIIQRYIMGTIARYSGMAMVVILGIFIAIGSMTSGRSPFARRRWAIGTSRTLWTK